MNLPNYITLFRIVLVPVFFSFLVYYNSEHTFFKTVALILFLIGVATDALDGLIARSFRKQTELGTFLDPLADKLLLLSGFFGILCSTALTVKPPLWIVIVIVFRDLFIVCGLSIIFLTTTKLRIRPNILGKLTTFFQMLTIVSVLTAWTQAHVIWWITVTLTIASSISYLVRGIKLVNEPTP